MFESSRIEEPRLWNTAPLLSCDRQTLGPWVFITGCHACQHLLRMCAKLLQSCPTLCDPMDRSPPGSSVHGILQARTLEWVAMHFSRDLPDPRIEPTSHVSWIWRAGSLPPAALRKPGASCHFLPQEIFLTQGSTHL